MSIGDFGRVRSMARGSLAALWVLGVATACRPPSPTSADAPTSSDSPSAADVLDELQQRISGAQSLHFVWEDRHLDEDPPHVNHGELWLLRGGRLRLTHRTEMGGETRELHVVGDGQSLWFWGSPGPAVSSKPAPEHLEEGLRAAMLTTHGGSLVFRILAPFVGGHRTKVPHAGSPDWLDGDGLTFSAVGEETVTVNLTLDEAGLPAARVFVDPTGQRHQETIETFDLDAPSDPTRFEPPRARDESGDEPGDAAD